MGLGISVLRLAAIAAATMWLAGCMTAPVGPENPGTKVRGKVPDPQKWVGGQNFGDKRWVYRCRPLACPELSMVSIRTSQSPTRSPDPQALQKFAQENAEREMTQAEQAAGDGTNRVRGLSLLSSRVANVKDYPAVHWEYRGTSADNKTLYIVRKMVFAGNSVIDIISSSLGLEVARRNSADFIGVMEIEDYAPPVR
jgi:hypothetical protein